MSRKLRRSEIVQRLEQLEQAINSVHSDADAESYFEILATPDEKPVDRPEGSIGMTIRPFGGRMSEDRDTVYESALDALPSADRAELRERNKE